jgi:3'-phosphoadenosine 5'-phosphosulfate sulfotransferase (PAPS reductase)/FAD synthetase
MRVRDVIEKYGFPLISKEQSQYIRQARNTNSDILRNIRLNGKKSRSGKNAQGKISEKWKFLLDAPFEVSEICCDKLKKAPFELFYKETGLKPIIGTMTEESRFRMFKYLKTGCNDFVSKKVASYPISIFTEKDIWGYKKEFQIPFSSAYDKGCKRTGCMFCGFGCMREKENENRFYSLNSLHPKAYQTFMRYTNSGVTYREALEYIGVNLPDEKNR